jgi:hypothetical protein
MAYFLTDKELDDILDDPSPPTLLGFGEYVYAHKVDIYSYYLERKFGEIDKEYPLKSQRNENKGKKGELLMCGIIDLTMWWLGFRLGKDYTVIPHFGPKGRNTVDFKLICLGTGFLCEAKNWDISTYVDKKTYEDKIKTRFFCKGINILMIRKDKIPSVEKMYKKYSTDNGQPINYIEIDHFMDAKKNYLIDINWNLLFGTNQLVNHITEACRMYRDFSIDECLEIGMPNWFISEYLNKSTKTINRYSKKLGYNRRSSAYRKLVKYRRIY